MSDDAREEFRKLAVASGIAKDFEVTIGKLDSDERTPKSFIEAVKKRWGQLSWDLAADNRGTVAQADAFYGPSDNSLVQPWENLFGNLWLNPPWPPYGDITPWVQKCAAAAHSSLSYTRFLLFIPAMTSAKWWGDCVDGQAQVNFLAGRFTDDPSSPYFRDLALCVYGEKPGYDLWRWWE